MEEELRELFSYIRGSGLPDDEQRQSDDEYKEIVEKLKYRWRGDISDLTQMLDSDDSSLREVVVIALGELDNEQAIGPLIKALDDWNKDVRRAAVWALRNFSNNRSVIASLLRPLRDWDREICKEAAIILGELKEENAVEPLIQMLRSDSEELRKVSAETLGDIGDDRAVEPLLERFEREGDLEVKKSLIEALGKIGDREGIDTLIRALRDEELRRPASEALINVGPETVEPLLWLLRSNDEGLRREVIKILGELGEIEVIEHLSEILRNEDESEELRKESAMALVRIKEESAVDSLLQILEDQNQTLAIRKVIMSALIDLEDKRVVGPLIQALEDEDRDMRIQAAIALGELKDGRALRPLVGLLDDEDKEVRIEAALALRSLEDVRAVEPLLQALKRWGRYDIAMEILINLGRTGITEPLVQALRDENREIRLQVAALLGELKIDRTIEPLIRTALNDESWHVRSVAISALGEFGPEAIEPLIEILRVEENEDARRVIMDVLADIGEGAIEPLVRIYREEKDRELRNLIREVLGDNFPVSSWKGPYVAIKRLLRRLLHRGRT